MSTFIDRIVRWMTVEPTIGLLMTILAMVQADH
jgi:hypothetical protein